MSSILSAQNLQTFRRRNIGRRCPCCLSLSFLSPPRPRPPERFCPNGIVTPPSRHSGRRPCRPVPPSAPRQADVAAAGHASRGGAPTRSAVCSASDRPPSFLRRHARRDGGPLRQSLSNADRFLSSNRRSR